ncbi:hypothetical protein F4775DRAFT_606257 [Biscogniauxia sp. FL1348]|nr:hypothetical protein F4775DRAFT_606257 [Biscogniauxia sp. FL1348]
MLVPLSQHRLTSTTMTQETLERVQTILHYSYPLTVFLYFTISSGIASIIPGVSTYTTKAVNARRKVIWYFLLLFIILFGVQLALKALRVLLSREWPSQDTVVGLLSCILVFGVEQNSLSTTSKIVWSPFYGSWLISLILEPINAAIIFIRLREAAWSTAPALYDKSLLFMVLDASITLVRVFVLLTVILAYFFGRHGGSRDCSNEEHTPLIPKLNQRHNGSADSGYGTNSDMTNIEAPNPRTINSSTVPHSSDNNEHEDDPEKAKKRWNSEGTVVHQIMRYSILLRLIWPANNRRLQLRIFLISICLIARNIVNFLIPLQYGALIDCLTGVSGWQIWVQVIFYAVLRVLDSSVGIRMLQELLWTPVELASNDALTSAAYAHTMSLSSEFHDSSSSSDLSTTISETNSPINLMRNAFLETIPILIDMVVAFSYLSAKFGPYEGFITATTGLAYIQISGSAISQMKRRSQRVIDALYRVNRSRNEGISGWHTVFDFHRQSYEINRYKSALEERTEIRKETKSKSSLNEILQDLVIMAGLLAGVSLAVYQIRQGLASTGDFVMLLSYWNQLTRPLFHLFITWQGLSINLVVANRLVDLLLTKPTVVDKVNAKPLKVKRGGGTVEFRNVSFSYDKKKYILKNFNLTIEAGCKVAFVGESGVGKSTILRLLARKYDVTSGSILIDGHDIRDVTQASLRKVIGIVPQNTFVFDNTIAKNVEYGRLGASMEDIKVACDKAAIHDQIERFTDKYETRVGERGIKISGGELQRIAIARAILRNPDIVLLDEATSAVDTITERKIQGGLDTLCEGKTTVAIAHRLSTVMNSDVIFVISEGKIIEKGTHRQLVAKRGKYSELWDSNFFVKAKEAEEEMQTAEGTKDTDLKQPPPSDNHQKHDSVIKAVNGNITSAATQTQLTGDTMIRGDKTNERQVVQTPIKPKEDVWRPNPDAPEFTPRSRSLPTSRPVPTSPIPIARSKPKPMTPGAVSPKQATRSPSITTVVRVYDDNSPPKPNSYSREPETGSRSAPTTEQQEPQPQSPRQASLPPSSPATPPAPEPRHRRNTMQLASCCPPDSETFQTSHSPVRSVSQPTPAPASPPPPRPPLSAVGSPATTPPRMEDYASAPNPAPEPVAAKIRARPAQHHRGRGRGGSRRGRGRARGGGRQHGSRGGRGGQGE